MSLQRTIENITTFVKQAECHDQSGQIYRFDEIINDRNIANFIDTDAIFLPWASL